MNQKSGRCTVLLRELHGPSLWGVRAGWLFDVHFEQRASQAWIPRFQAWLTALDLPRPERPPIRVGDPRQACIDLAQSLIEPFVLQNTPVWPESWPAARQPCLLHCRVHDLAGPGLALAVRILRLALQGSGPDAGRDQQALRGSVLYLQERASLLCAHAFSNAVIDHAAQRGLPWWILDECLGGAPLLQIGSGSRARLLSSTCIDVDGYIGGSVCRDKTRTHRILARLGYQVPRQISLPKGCSPERLLAAARVIGFPCVLKPADGRLGIGVTARIEDQQSLLAALPQAEEAARSGLVLEQHVPGDYHRLVILHGRLVRVRRFRPPHLVGDGQRSIRLILEEASSGDPRSVGVFCDGPLPPVDGTLERLLRSQGFGLDDVPPAELRVELRFDLVDRDDWVDDDLLNRVDVSLIRMAEDLTRAVGMSNLGLDVLSPDITRPVYEQSLWVIELNAVQRLHPTGAAPVLDPMFPQQASAWISISVVVFAPGLDWPQPDQLEVILQAHPDFAVALARRLQSRLPSETLAALTQQRPVLPYQHPREPLMNRSMEALLFLIDWQEFLQSGLPAAQLDRLQLLGEPPAAMASRWQELSGSLLPRLGQAACCLLPEMGPP